jgi:hypothetical protein
MCYKAARLTRFNILTRTAYRGEQCRLLEHTDSSHSGDYQAVRNHSNLKFEACMSAHSVKVQQLIHNSKM